MKLKSKALENATVTKGTKNSQQVLKEGSPVSIAEKTRNSKRNTIVGLSKGVTKNMDNYESLRIDVWCTDELNNGEEMKDGIQRINEVLDEVLVELVEDYL